MMGGYQVEICTGGIEDVITASRFPIDRIELNSALELGGLSPSLSLLEAAKRHTRLPILCMVRPRTAGFVYSEAEFHLMKHDAASLLEHGADGIVFGFLNPDRTVDELRTKEMTDLIHGHQKTAVFHRAFDLVQDADQAMETLIACGIDRVLTSGLAPTAPEGAGVLRHMIKRYGRSIEIQPGCGIRADNIKELLQTTGASCFHMSAKSMRNDCGEYAAVDARKIQAVLGVLNTMSSEHASVFKTLTREDDELLKQEKYEKQFD